MDFGTLTSDSLFYERMAAVFLTMIIGAFNRAKTETLLVALLAAILGTDYAGVMIAVLLSLVTKITGVVNV